MKFTIVIEGKSHKQILERYDDLPLHGVREQLVKHKGTSKRGGTSSTTHGVTVTWDGKRIHK